MDDLLRMPSPSKVVECIEGWRDLDLRDASSSSIEQSLRAFLDDIGEFALGQIHLSGLRTYYRVRVLQKRCGERDPEWPWDGSSHLLYPPEERAGQQRCNVPGEQVLYCSSEVITALREVHVAPGDTIVLICYQVRDMSLEQVVSKAVPTHLDGRPLFDGDGLLSYRIMRDFVRSEFTKPVGRGTEFLHKLSAGFCRTWFDDPEAAGWMYPSVESPRHACVAFKKRLVDSNNLAINWAGVFEVLGEQDRAFVLRRRERAKLDASVVEWVESHGNPRWVKSSLDERHKTLIFPMSQSVF